MSERCEVCRHRIDPATAPVHPSCSPPAPGDLPTALAVLVAAELVTLDAAKEALRDPA